MQPARDRIREITDQQRLLLGVEMVVQDLNRFLRGWAGYSIRKLPCALRPHHHVCARRLALFVAKRHKRHKRHKRASGYGMTVVAYLSPDRMGLINLDRLVVTPSPFRDWRAKPNADGEGRR